MKLLDSNILIHSAKDEYKVLRELYREDGVSVSEITRVELLGYHKLTPEQRTFYEAIFNVVRILPLTREVIDKAIKVRRGKNMAVADALIAATAAVNGLELITQIMDDFAHLKAELVLTNPIPATR